MYNEFRANVAYNILMLGSANEPLPTGFLGLLEWDNAIAS